MPADSKLDYRLVKAIRGGAEALPRVVPCCGMPPRRVATRWAPLTAVGVVDGLDESDEPNANTTTRTPATTIASASKTMTIIAPGEPGMIG